MAHYLTFVSNISCTVNGTSVSSGYELHDGDVIVATTTTTGVYLTVNSNWYADDSTVDITDSDVQVSITSQGGGNN